MKYRRLLLEVSEDLNKIILAFLLKSNKYIFQFGYFIAIYKKVRFPHGKLA